VLIRWLGSISVEKLDSKEMQSENSTGVGSGFSATRLEDSLQTGRTAAGHNAADVPYDIETHLRGIGAQFIH
jgi:hypothetical protein